MSWATFPMRALRNSDLKARLAVSDRLPPDVSDYDPLLDTEARR